MITIERAELKKEFSDLIKIIHKNHNTKDDDRVEKELFETHNPVEGLANTRCYFMMATNAGPLNFISYDMEYMVINPELHLVARTVRSVTVYENFVEYESNRVKQMSTGKDQTGLTLN